MTKNLKKVLLSIFVGVALISASMFVLMANTKTSQKDNYTITQVASEAQEESTGLMGDSDPELGEDFRVNETDPEYQPEDDVEATYTLMCKPNGGEINWSSTSSDWSQQSGTGDGAKYQVTTSASSVKVSVILPAVTRPGYECKGWATSSSSTTTEYPYGFGVSGSIITLSGNLWLWAVWEPATGKVILNANGGTGGTSAVYYKYNTNIYYSDSSCTSVISSITKPIRTGYTFVEYEIQSAVNNGTAGERYIYSDGTFASDLCYDFWEVVTLYAVWDPNVYHASFDYNNGAKQNLIEMEWAGDINGSLNTTTSTWTANAISGNTYSYAKVQTYNGGSLVKEVSVGYDGARISTTITKDSTWNRLRIGFNGSANDSGFWMNCSGLTAGKYTISYFVDISDDGTTGTLSEIKLEAGEAVSAFTSASPMVTYDKTHTLPTPTRLGYTFNGWVKTSVNTSYNWSAGSSSNYSYQTIMSNIAPGEKVHVSIDSAKLTAGSASKFSILLYDFTDTTIGTLVQKDVEFGEGINVSLTCPTSAISGHNICLLIYAGQSGSTAGNSVQLMHCRVSWSGSSQTYYKTSYTHTTAGNVSFMADWTPNTHTVSFDSNGGNSVSSKTVEMGSTYGPMPTPTREGYTFDGWVNNYFDTVDFVNYYQNGQPGEICYGVPQITSSGYLHVYSYSTYFRNDSNEWTEYGYPIYLQSGTYTLSATAYWTGGTEGYVGTYLGISSTQIDGGALASLQVNSATEKQYTVTFTISTSGTYYMNAYWYYGYNTYYKDITLTRIDGAKWQNHDGDSSNTGDYVISSTEMVYPFNHTLVAHWTAKSYTVTTSSNIGYVTTPTPSYTKYDTEISMRVFITSAYNYDYGYQYTVNSVKIYGGTSASGDLLQTSYPTAGSVSSLRYVSTYVRFTMEDSGKYYDNLYVVADVSKAAKTYSVTSGTSHSSYGAGISVASSGTYDSALSITTTTPTRVGYDFTPVIKVYNGTTASGTLIETYNRNSTTFDMSDYSYCNNVYVYVDWTMTGKEINIETSLVTDGIVLEFNDSGTRTFNHGKTLKITITPPTLIGQTIQGCIVRIYGKNSASTMMLRSVGDDATLLQEVNATYNEESDNYTSSYDVGGSTYYDTLVVEAEVLATQNAFNITFDKNASDATGTMEVLSNIMYGSSQDLPSNGFSRTGYTFAGWATSSNGSVVHTNNDVLSVDEVNAYYTSVGAGGTYTLYAIWKPKSVTVNVQNLSGTSAEGYVMGESDGSFSGIYTVGNTITLTTSSSKYQFAKWVKGTSWNDIQVGSTYTITAQDGETGEITISACYQYTINIYAVTNFVVNSAEGGSICLDSASSGLTTKTYPYATGEFEKSLYATPNSGYLFSGWFNDSACTNTLSPTSPYQYDAEGKTGWGGNNYTFNFYALFVKDLSSSEGEKGFNIFEVRINQGLVYDGTEQVLLEVIDSDGIDNNIYYSISKSLDITNYSIEGSTSLPKGTAGEYTVYYYAPPSGNYLEIIGSAVVEIEVPSDVDNPNKLENTFEVKINTDLVYDGTEQVLLEVIDSDGIDNNIYYSIGTELDIDNFSTIGSTDLPKGTGGTYVVYFYAPTSTNYKELKGFTEVTIKVPDDLNEDKLDNIVTVTIYENLVFTGYNQVLLVATDIDEIDDNIYYSVGTELDVNNYTIDGSTSLPTGTCGEYTVYYYVPASENYKEASGSAIGKIDGIQSTLTILPNGGDYVGETEIVGTTGDETVVGVPTRCGYTFDGWVLGGSGSIDESYKFVFGVGDATLTAQWIAIEYTISFDKNSEDATGTMDSQTFTFDNDQNLNTNAFIREGFEFTGWIGINCQTTEEVSINSEWTAKEIVKQLGYGYSADNSIMLYAQWSATYYTAKVVLMNTAGEYDIGNVTTQTISADAGSTVTLAGEASKITVIETIPGGIEFDYATDGENVKETIIVNEDGSTVVYFYFKRIEHALSYNTNGGDTIESITLRYGQKYGQLPTPVREGYSSTGWYTGATHSDNCASAFVGNVNANCETYEMGTEDVTIHAHWQEVTYYITLELMGGTYETLSDGWLLNDDSKPTYSYTITSEVITLPKAEFKYTGHTNLTWYAEYSNGEFVGNEILVVEQGSSGNKTFYAKWEKQTYILTVDFGYNSLTETHTQEFESILDISNPTRDGYTFASWTHTSGAGQLNQVIDGNGNTTSTSFVFGAGNATITAKWTPIQYTVTIKLDGGAFDDAEPDNEIWTIVDGGYSTNYATSEQNQEIIFPTLKNRDGYEFAGWTITTNSIDTGSTVAEGKLTIPANDHESIEISANWNVITYTATLVPNGGTIDDEKWSDLVEEYDVEDSAITLPTPVREGYRFDGWYQDIEFTIGPVEKITTGTIGNRTYYAKWTAITITITWVGNAPDGAMLTDADLWNYAGSIGYTSSNAGSKYLYTINAKTATSSVTYAQVLGYYAPIPLIAGYTLDGWYVFDEDTQTITDKKIANNQGSLVACDGYVSESLTWLSTKNVTLKAKYTLNSYNITFNYDSGIAGGSDPSSYTVENYSTVYAPTKEGYTFTGWTVTAQLAKQNLATIGSDGVQGYDSANDGAVYFELFYIHSDVTSYTVSGGAIHMYTTAGAYYAYEPSTTIAGNNNYIVNWYQEGNDASTINITFNLGNAEFNLSKYKFTGNVEFTALWKADVTSLTVNPEGGTWRGNTSFTLVEGVIDQTETIEDPIRAGYEFTGWTLTGSGSINGQTFTFGAGASILTANWEVVYPVITKFEVTPYDEEQSASVITYNRTDAVFTIEASHDLELRYQWYRMASGSEFEAISEATGTTYTHTSTLTNTGTYFYKCVVAVYVNGAKICETQSEEIKLIVEKCDTIFGVQVATGLVVEYNEDKTTKREQELLKVTLESTNTESVLYYSIYLAEEQEDGTETLTLVKDSSMELPAASQYGMYEVFFNADETTNYKSMEGGMYVEIKPLYTTLIIDPNGGEYAGDLEVTNKNDEQLTIVQPSREGYKFDKWEIVGGGQFDAETGKYTFGATNATLTAQWIGQEYDIIIDENYNDAPEAEDLKYTAQGTSQTKELPTLTRNGYTFSSWTIITNSQTTGATVSGNELTIPANDYGDITVQAQWTVNTDNNVTINANGGIIDGNNSISYIPGTEITITLPSVTREGYMFADPAWTINAPNASGSSVNAETSGESTVYKLTIPATGYGVIELTANWTGLTYNIKLWNNDGTANFTTKTYTTQGTENPIDLGMVERNGYTFAGWEFVEGKNTTPESEITGTNKTTLTITANAHDDVEVQAIWTGKTYTISYDANNGTISGTYDSSYTTGDEPQNKTLPTVTRDGYTFAGWAFVTNTNSGSAINGTNTKITIPANAYGDISLVAQWTGIEYNIVINENGGDSVDDLTYTTADEDQHKTLPTVTRAGYTFDRWEIVTNSKPTGSSVNGSELTIPANDYDNITIKAIWKGISDNNIDLRLGYGNNDIFKSKSYETKENSQVVDLTATEDRPERAGYTFNGWEITSNSVTTGSTLDATGFVLTIPANDYGDITLTATWSVITYTITFVRNGGEWATGYTYPTSYNVESNSITLPTSDNISKTGYTFAGWYNNEGLSGDAIATISTGSINDKTFYAKWTINQYTLTINANEGTYPGTNPVTADYGSEIEIANPTREGYTFDSWSVTAGELKYEDRDSDDVIETYYQFSASDAVLTANWTINQYTLTLDFGCDDITETYTQNYGTSKQIETPQRTGYIFGGWTLTGAGVWAENIRTYTFGAGDGILKASWTTDEYSITLIVNGGTISNLDANWTDVADGKARTYTVLDTIILPIFEDMAKTGYTFNGWYAESDFSGSAVVSVGPNLTGDKTFYAKWVANTYTINYSANATNVEGTLEPTVLQYGDIYTVPSNPYTRQGYTFAGWAETDGATGRTDWTIGSNFNWNYTTGTILYAQWTVNSYTLTINANGGTYTGTNPITANYGSKIEVQDPTLSGYNFKEWQLTITDNGQALIVTEGWATSKTEGVTTFTFGAVNITATAVWSLIGDTEVTLYYQEGTESFLKDSTNAYVDYTFETNVGTATTSNSTALIVDSIAFNGTHSLSVTPTATNGKATYTYNNMPTGTYKFGAYVRLSDVGTIKFMMEHVAGSALTTLFTINETNQDKDIWHYVEATFTVASTNDKVCLYIYGDTNTTYYIDDIKISKSGYTPETSFTNTAVTPKTQLPYAVKAGYTFIGWNESSTATTTTTTGWATYYGDDNFGSKTYYAIYELSNPTAVANGTDSIYYGEKDVTLNVNVSAEGVNVEASAYQWYISTDRATYSLIEGATSTTYVHTATSRNVGTYYYICKITTVKGETTSNSVCVEVTKAEQSVVVEMSGYTYAGTLSEPTYNSKVGDGEITFYYNTTNSYTGADVKEWKDITSTTLNAGTYYMFATLAETTNYSAGYSSNIVEFVVAKATIEIDFTVNDGTAVMTGTKLDKTYTATYDADGLTISVFTTNVNATLSYNGTTTTMTIGDRVAFPVAMDAGTYVYNYTVSAPNYEDVVGKLTIVINPASKAVSWELLETYIYNGADQSADVKAYITAVDGTTKLYCDVTFDRAFINVGTYTATATINNSNYVLTNNTKQISITKAENAFTIDVAQGLVYNGQAQQLLEVIDNNGTDNDVYYSIGTPLNENNYNNPAIASTDKPTGTNAGTYDVYFYVPSNDSYLETYGSMSVTIAKYNLSNATIATIPEQPFTGSEVEPKPEVTALGMTLTENIDFKFMYSNNINATSEAVLTITAVADGNYVGSQTVNFTIKGSFVTVPTNLGNLVYNGTEQTARIEESDLYTITNNKQTDAGTYQATVTLKDTTNYAWDNEGNTREPLTIEWQILKADVTIALDASEVSARIGETGTIGATITLAYTGNIDGNALTISGAGDYATFSATSLVNSKATITVTPTKSTSGQTVIVKYAGDDNHNESNEATFTIKVPASYVDIVVDGDVGGIGSVNGIIAGTENELRMGSVITFTATPATGYGLIKYSVQGATTYMGVDNTRELDAIFESSDITINDALLNGRDTLTITLYFDEIVEVEMNMDETNTGSITYDISTNYENNVVNYKYDTLNNKLTAFKKASVDISVEANKVDNQYYAVKSVVVGSDSKTTNALNTNINTDVSSLTDDGDKIVVTAAKLYDSTTRSVTQNNVGVGTVNIISKLDTDTIGIEGTDYIIEGSSVDVTIAKTNSDYDFLGIKIGNTVTLKAQLTGEWTHSATSSTWANQELGDTLYSMDPVMLEKWYTPATTTNRTIEVQVDSGISAVLENTDIGYKYTLANDIFSSGTDPLYAGNWKVKVDNATTNYNVEVVITTASGTSTYGVNETFTINSTITSVVIRITAVTAN